MNASAMIERKLESVLAMINSASAPAGLTQAITHAVMPGGARVRPRLCLAAALACGNDDPDLALSAAAAIEMLHCASLVHDDLPCFDDATVRRGRPSVHCAFGERLAVLTGDALIVMAFETVALSKTAHPERIGSLTALIARSVGTPFGIAAGQAWECEQKIDVEAYHRAKTGALFVGSAEAGALAAGSTPSDWTRFGEYLGLAYQTADDLQDALGDVKVIGKPVGRDAALSRPSAVAELGAAGAVKRVTTLVHEAVSSIPQCPQRHKLIDMVFAEMQRFLPKQVQLRAVA